MDLQTKVDNSTVLSNFRSIDRQTGYLTKDSCDCIKGICSILVIIHHFNQRTAVFSEITLLQYFCSQIGHLSVSVFFFLSAYGLYISSKKNGEKYVKNFAKNKILPFYCVDLLLIALYTVYAFVSGSHVSLGLLVKSILFGDSVIAYGWYIQVQLLFYLYFYIVFKLIKPKNARYLLIAALVFAQCVVLYILDFGVWWYRSCFSFVLGFFWAEYQNTVNKIIASVPKWITALVVSFSLFMATGISGKIISIYYLSGILTLACDIFFVAFVILFISRVNITFSFTRWLGKYSFEIYVLQGLFFRVYHSIFINIKNNYLYGALVLFSCLIASVLFHPVIQKIYAIARKKA